MHLLRRVCGSNRLSIGSSILVARFRAEKRHPGQLRVLAVLKSHSYFIHLYHSLSYFPWSFLYASLCQHLCLAMEMLYCIQFSLS